MLMWTFPVLVLGQRRCRWRIDANYGKGVSSDSGTNPNECLFLVLPQPSPSGSPVAARRMELNDLGLGEGVGSAYVSRSDRYRELQSASRCWGHPSIVIRTSPCMIFDMVNRRCHCAMGSPDVTLPPASRDPSSSGPAKKRDTTRSPEMNLAV